MRSKVLIALVAAAALSAIGVLSLLPAEDDTALSPVATSTSSPSTSTPTSTTRATTTSLPSIAWPALPVDGVVRAVVTPTGVVLAVRSVAADGRFVAIAPCGGDVTVVGTPIGGATVVLDPGHGGDEPGAVGPGGSRETDVNLAVAQEAKRLLEAHGATAVLTRTADYRVTLESRAAIATALRPLLFISIHHNAEPDGAHAGPGSETYFQIASADSKRAAGLIYEEVERAFATYDIAWVGDSDAGAKYRRRADGGDYYGILNRSAGVPAVLSEAAFISNPPEEALLADPSFRAVEAAAITRAVIRFATTSDPGSGFVEPYTRTQPAGPGGGSVGCTNPPLG